MDIRIFYTLIVSLGWYAGTSMAMSAPRQLSRIASRSAPALGTAASGYRVPQPVRPSSRTIMTMQSTQPETAKELTPTIAHLRSLDTSLSEASLLNRMRSNEIHAWDADYAKCTYETIGAYKGNKKLKTIAKRVIRQEIRGLKDREQYYTYYHTHQWSIDLAQRIYAELYPSKDKEFFPLHFLTLMRPPIRDEQHLIKVLQKAGGILEAGHEKYLLSVNTAFFGNLGQYDESTACLFSMNWSIRPPKKPLQTLFTLFGHPDLYSKYASEWKKVEALHDAASSYGKVWLIKIPKKVHSQVVIPAKAFGHKQKFVIDGKETDDVDLIQETLRTRPDAIKDVDRMQFRILMTPSTGLNPDLGIKTVPMNCADPEKYAAFEKAFDVLMAKVKADILAQETSRAGINPELNPVVEEAD